MKRSHKLMVLIICLYILIDIGGCTSSQIAVEKQLVANKEILTFPIGQPLNSYLFNGTVYTSRLVGHDSIFNNPDMSYAVFEPGVISIWHSHTDGQILLVTDGIGYHQMDGKSIEVLYPGDVVKCPPGVKHWHGATPNSWFAHISIGNNPRMDGLENDFISDQEYKTLPKNK
jgi:quercetin dioxygenase-like cupin family protein